MKIPSLLHYERATTTNGSNQAHLRIRNGFIAKSWWPHLSSVEISLAQCPLIRALLIRASSIIQAQSSFLWWINDLLDISGCLLGRVTWMDELFLRNGHNPSPFPPQGISPLANRSRENELKVAHTYATMITQLHTWKSIVRCAHVYCRMIVLSSNKNWSV